MVGEDKALKSCFIIHINNASCFQPFSWSCKDIVYNIYIRKGQ